MCICPDLGQQVAETHDFFLQVFGQEDDLVAGGPSLLPGVQREHQLHGAEGSWFRQQDKTGSAGTETNSQADRCCVHT